MNKKKKKDINTSIGKAITTTLDFVSITLKLIIYTIIIVGASSSFLLYLQVFPVEAMKLYESFRPVFKILFNILQIVVGVFGGILIAWILFNILEPVISKAKRRKEEGREKFLDDLAAKMNKKLKSKK